jgi:hypothetical protein
MQIFLLVRIKKIFFKHLTTQLFNVCIAKHGIYFQASTRAFQLATISENAPYWANESQKQTGYFC